MTDIHLTGVPEELVARIEAAWQRAVAPLAANTDDESYWSHRARRNQELADAYNELFRLPLPRLLSNLVVDAEAKALGDAQFARRELERVQAEAVSR